MSGRSTRFCTGLLLISTLLTGCHPISPHYLDSDEDLSHLLTEQTAIEYPDVCHDSLDEVRFARPPRTVTNPEFDSIWDLSLEEAISITLQNSKVIRSFGTVRQFGQILGGPPERLTSAPQSITTIYDPAIQESGQTGVEQALSVFDASFNFSAAYQQRDRPQNLSAATGLTRLLSQDQLTINTDITKRTAVGTQWTIRNASIYEANDPLNLNGRVLDSTWFTAMEVEARQPFLRGRGTQVNRVPVILARMRTDVSLADFEIAVRNLLNEVEFAYWELYFFYRNLESSKIARDSALTTWQRVYALFQEGSRGGEAQQEAQAREQYFFFRAQLETAQRDVFKSENRLRYLMGLAATDGRLIRPSDEPATAKVTFDWHAIHEESLNRSPELRRQKWNIKQREMELIAARNQLLPQVDGVLLYRWLGLGDNFNTFSRTGKNFDTTGGSTAVNELLEGRYQELEAQLQVAIPIGFRRELSQVRNQQLQLARERARLEDMELELTSQLTDAFQNLEAQHDIARSNLNRRVAAERQVEALLAAYDTGTISLDILLDAQRRRADAEAVYYQSIMEYNLTLLTVHLRKGSLLEYNGVLLAEGPWPCKAYADAHERARRRDASYYLDYGYSRPRVISQGPTQQLTGTAQPVQNEIGSTKILDDDYSDGVPFEEVPLEPVPIDGVPFEKLPMVPSDEESSTDSVPSDPVIPETIAPPAPAGRGAAPPMPSSSSTDPMRKAGHARPTDQTGTSLASTATARKLQHSSRVVGTGVQRVSHEEIVESEDVSVRWKD